MGDFVKRHSEKEQWVTRLKLYIHIHIYISGVEQISKCWGGGGGLIMLYLYVGKSVAYPLLLDFRTVKGNIFPSDKLQSSPKRRFF